MKCFFQFVEQTAKQEDFNEELKQRKNGVGLLAKG